MRVQAYQGDYHNIENSVLLIFDSWPETLLYKKLKIDDRDFKKNGGPILISVNNNYLKRSLTCERDIRKIVLKLLDKYKYVKSFGIVIPNDFSVELGFTKEKLARIFVDVCETARKSRKFRKPDCAELIVKLISVDIYVYYVVKDELTDRRMG